MNFTIENGLNSQYLRISDPEYHYTFGYYSNNSWVDDHRLILGRFKAPDPAHRPKTTPIHIPDFSQPDDLVLIDFEQDSETVLVPDVGYGSFNYVVYGHYLYYIHNGSILYRLDVNSRETSEICRGRQMDQPHMTADGNYLSWTSFSHDLLNAGERVNLTTGEVTRIFEKKFAPPFPIANHVMICPTDPDLLFFSHEGDTFYISNRLWLARLGEPPRNIARQHLNIQGDLGDCFGHECWAPDGKGLYFVKYPCSPCPPQGISYVDISTGETTVLFSKYPYWHASAAANGRYLAADTTSGSYSGVCLIDLQTGEEKMLVKARTNWTHPCHPHPMFNLTCDKLCFHELDDNGQVAVGIIDL